MDYSRRLTVVGSASLEVNSTFAQGTTILTNTLVDL